MGGDLQARLGGRFCLSERVCIFFPAALAADLRARQGWRAQAECLWGRCKPRQRTHSVLSRVLGVL